MSSNNFKSNLAYIIEWLINDALNAFDLIIQDATSINDDILLRSKIASALWASALLKLSKFRDYIVALGNPKANKRDRNRAEALFNLESDTIIKDCGIDDVPVIKALRAIRHELSHGASGGLELQNFTRLVIINGIPFVHCYILDANTPCNCEIFVCDKSTEGSIVRCKVSVYDVRDAVINGIKTWYPAYKNEVESVVIKRWESLPPCSSKPSTTKPWWYEQCEELFAYSL